MASTRSQLPSNRKLVASLCIASVCFIVVFSSYRKDVFGVVVGSPVAYKQNVMSSKPMHPRRTEVLHVTRLRQKPDEPCPNCTNHNAGSTTTILSDKPIVLVLAYYRSGSTLTGQLLQENPNTFYVFEPIRLVRERFMKAGKGGGSVNMSYISGYRIYNKNQHNKVIEDEIKAWLTCDLDSLSIQSLTDSHLQFSNAFSAFPPCIGLPYFHYHDKCMVLNATHKQRIKECIRPIINFCKQSLNIVIKFIRENARDAKRLMPLFPAMKIVHLVRDPRGMINSQTKVDHSVNYTPTSILDFCKIHWENLQTVKELMREFPGRVRLQRYEDIAEFPFSTSESLYNFVGFNYTERTVQFLKLNTNAKANGSPYGVARKNSKLTASTWRTRLDFSLSQSVYDTCNKSMAVLGYLPFVSPRDLANMTMPSRLLINATEELLNKN